MPVTIKKKALTPVSLVKRLFNAEDVMGGLMKLAQALEYNGYKLTTKPNQFIIENEHALLSSVEINMNTVTMAMQGKLGHVAKTVIRDQVIDLIKTAYNLMPEVAEQINIDKIYKETMAVYWPEGNKIAAIKKYRELTGAGLKEAKDKIEAWISVLDDVAGPKDTSKKPTFKAADAPELPKTLGEMLKNNPDAKVTFDLETNDENGEPYFVGMDMAADSVGATTKKAPPKGKPVLLENADQLMQPVKGTSGNSVYHVIAIGQGFVVAGRLKTDNSLSIRALCTDSSMKSGVEKGFKAAGLEWKDGGHYSVHLSPDTQTLAQKCFGAVMFAMGLPIKEIVTNIGPLKGAGA